MSEKKKACSLGYQRATIRRLRQKSGVTVDHAHDNSSIRLRLPYLNYDIFDDRGIRSMGPHLMQLLQWPSLYFPMYLSDKGAISSSFMLCFKLNISRRLYVSDSIAYPLTLDLTPNYVKTSSKRMTVHMTEHGVIEPLATATWVEVNVDLRTKRPSPFPDWWKQKYGFPSEGPPLEISPLPKPSYGVIISYRKITYTDIDSNGHTQFSAYVAYCLDAFYENVLHDRYKYVSKIFLRGWVRDISVTFKGETMVGEWLTIESWEDSIDKDVFHFEVSAERRRVILLSCSFYAALEDYSKL